MKWPFLMVLASAAVLDCSTDYCLCGFDGGNEDVITPVVNGDPCAVEGTTAPGILPSCSSSAPHETLCACQSGRWRCGDCDAGADATSDASSD